MKLRVLSLITLLALFSLSNSYGVIIPNWERPVMKAQLIETDSDGIEINSQFQKDLTLLNRVGSNLPSSIHFTEEEVVYCITAPCPPIKRSTTFRVMNALSVGCGSVKYIAIEENKLFRRGELNDPPKSLELVDHSRRTCDDYREFTWEATLNYATNELPRFFRGTPEPLYTIQSSR